MRTPKTLVTEAYVLVNRALARFSGYWTDLPRVLDDVRKAQIKLERAESALVARIANEKSEAIRKVGSK